MPGGGKATALEPPLDVKVKVEFLLGWVEGQVHLARILNRGERGSEQVMSTEAGTRNGTNHEVRSDAQNVPHARL